MNLTLLRTYNGADCTLGVLTLDGLTLQTIEKPWVPGQLGGAKSVSCVPKGIYQLVKHDSEAHPQTWALVNHLLGIGHWPNESNRSTILIHPANYESELKGCVAPGMSTGLNAELGVRMVMESRKAFALLKNALPWTDGHELEIK